MAERINFEAIKARVEKAHTHIGDICTGKTRWKMTIPADPERDSDLILSIALNDVDVLLAELAAIREAGVDPGLLRWCRWPGCWRSYNAATGPIEDPGWIRCDHNSFLLCPPHAASGHQYKTTIQRAPLSLLVFCECGEHADLGGNTNLDDGAAWWTSHVAASRLLSVEGKDTND